MKQAKPSVLLRARSLKPGYTFAYVPVYLAAAGAESVSLALDQA